MKIRLNDATELQIQSAVSEDGMLRIKTISATLPELREKFSDGFACKRMEVIEREQTAAVYEGYTKLDRLEDYGAGILGGVLYQEGESTEERMAAMESKQEITDAAVQELILTMLGGM